MTDPVENPSVLARLAVVVTAGVVIGQIFFVAADLVLLASKGHMHNDTYYFVGIAAPLSLFAVASLYYIFKGKPTNADAVIASRLYRAWAISVIGGTIFTLIQFWVTLNKVDGQFRF